LSTTLLKYGIVGGGYLFSPRLQPFQRFPGVQAIPDKSNESAEDFQARFAAKKT
jgi:hypothetical protein